MDTRCSESGFQTQADVRRLLSSAGLRPRKRYGQNFLIDRRLMERVVEAAEIGPGDLLLEVGAGTGSLTSLLAARAGRVVAVEVDAGLAAIAARTVASAGNVTLLVCDALDRKSRINPRIIDELSRTPAAGRRLVANLPYDIATPLLMNILLSDLGFGRLCAMVQHEVAQRFVAPCGHDAYGAVSVMTQALGRAAIAARAPRQAFWPQPKVESAVITIDPRPAAESGVSDSARFSAVVRGFFGYRRKTLERIAIQLGMAAGFVEKCRRAGIDHRARPEQVDVPQWVRLAEALARSRR